MKVFSYFKTKVSFQILEQSLRLIFNVFVFYYVSDFFDFKTIASFNFGLTLSALFVAFNTLGLSNTLVVELENRDKSQILSSSLLISFFGTLFSILICIPITFFFKNLDFNIVILTVFAFSFKFNNINKSFLVALDFHKLNSILEILVLIIFIPLKILSLIKFGIFGFLISSLLENLISVLIHFVYYKKLNISFTSINIDLIKVLLKNALPFFLSSLIIGLYTRFDQLFLAYFIDNEELSKYYVGIKINNTFLLLIGVIISSYFPLMHTLMLKSKQNFLNEFKKIVKYLYLLGLMLILFNIIFAENIFTLIFDEKFRDTGWISALHSSIILFAFFGAISDNYSAILRDKKFIYDKYLATLFISISLNIILVPIYGILGSLISLIISQVYNGLFSDFFSKKRKELFYAKIPTLKI